MLRKIIQSIPETPVYPQGQSQPKTPLKTHLTKSPLLSQISQPAKAISVCQLSVSKAFPYEAII